MRYVIEVDAKTESWQDDAGTVVMKFENGNVHLGGKPLGINELDSVIEGLTFMKELLVEV